MSERLTSLVGDGPDDVGACCHHSEPGSGNVPDGQAIVAAFTVGLTSNSPPHSAFPCVLTERVRLLRVVFPLCRRIDAAKHCTRSVFARSGLGGPEDCLCVLPKTVSTALSILSKDEPFYLAPY